MTLNYKFTFSCFASCRSGAAFWHYWKAVLLAAMLAITIAATGAVLHAGDPGQVTILNPKSYPLVGGTWTVDLDVLEAGDLRVATGEGTVFGRDVEFAGMHGDGTSILPSLAGQNLHFGNVPVGQWTFEVKVLTDGPHHLRLEMGGQTHYASNTASFASVTSTTPDGRYGTGEAIDVRMNFTEPVALDVFKILDDEAGGTFEVLDNPTSIAITQIGSQHYALVSSWEDKGVQIIDITDPIRPSPVAHVTDGATDGNGDTFDKLLGAFSIATTQIGDSHYALVAGRSDDGVQIINITDPASPTAVASITDGSAYPELRRPYSITTTQIGSSHYALVAAGGDAGVQIINITDPASPTAAAHVIDSSTYPELSGAASITTTKIGSNHYALVAAQLDDGVQIINITNPASPTAVAGITNDATDGNGDTFDALDGANFITTTQIEGSHYALVASIHDDGVQIINITDPASPTAVAGITNGATDGNGDTFDVLDGAFSITTTQIGSSHYALVAAYYNHGVQIINITDPASPTAVVGITEGAQFQSLNNAYNVAVAEIGGTHYAFVAGNGADAVQMLDLTDPVNPFDPLIPYIELDLAGDRRATYTGLEDGGKSMVFEYVVLEGDMTDDLAYKGTGSLKLGPNVPKDADDSTDISSVTLPEPGTANSLSHNKEIVLIEFSTSSFATTWRTATGSDEITLPISGSDMTVNWGDGQTSTGVSTPVDHTYNTAGDYTIQITGGLTRFHLNGTADASKLISLDQWGTASWTTMANAFRGATNMAYNAADSPDLSSVTDMSNMFSGATSFNGALSGWDISSVDNMSNMFSGATSFNDDLSGWDVSSVTDMTDMFDGATLFDQNLGMWYVNLDSTEIAGAPGKVGGISAQNQILQDQNPVYDIGDGPDSNAFEISGRDLRMKISPDMHDYMVSITSTGSFGSDNHRVYNVTVTSNLPPVLDAIENATVAEGALLGFAAVARDPSHESDTADDDTLAFTLGSHPSDAVISAGGQFTWTPSEAQDGLHTITVQVSDGIGGTDLQEFTVTVTEVNVSPVLSSIPDLSGNEGTPFRFDADATDTDVIGSTSDILTYSLEGDTLTGASFDTSTGVLSWTPGEEYDGTYDVTVRVTDGSGAMDTEDLKITVDEVNTPPTARAGTYVPHGEGVAVTLDGSGSTDPDIINSIPDPLTYLWTQTGSGHTVTLSGADTASPTFTSPTVLQNTTLTFQLRVTDGAGAAVTDTATVLITDDINELPEAQAGLTRTVNEGDMDVTLDGTSSSDPNGETLTHVWSQTGGTPTVALTDEGTGKVSFAIPVVAADQPLTFTLNVTDSRGGSDTDEVVITVRDSASNAPSASISGGSREVNENSPVTLDGSGSSDPNGDTLTYTWSQTGGTPDVGLSSANDTASFTTPVVKEETQLTFTLVVNDGNEDDNTSVVITVRNNESDSPVAVATGPQEVDEEGQVTLVGSNSSDPNGDTLTYSWKYLTGTPVLELTGSDVHSLTFTAPYVVQPTDLVFGLTVRDTDGNENDATLTVRVLNSINEPPEAAATGPADAGEGVTVTLVGSGSSDPNGDNLLYQWEYLTGTPALTLLDGDTATPEFVTPHVKDAVDLEFRLNVTDSPHGDSDTADVTVTLLDTLSNLPVSVPGQDQTVGEGAPVTLDGSGSSDPNDDALSYEWAQVAGPDVVLSAPNFNVTTFQAPTVSSDVMLEFSLTVTDVDGSHVETVLVRVQNSQTNTPIARPQVSGAVHEGETVTLDGSDSYDPNNDVITHLWRQISGLPVTLSGETTDMATFTAPRIPDPVTLVFELAVTDDITTGTTRLSVVIPDDRNDPPILQAIPAQSEDELQEVSFQASATDVDGNDLRYALAGDIPRGASITRDGLFSWTTNQSQDGSYSLNLTVSDGDGGTDSGLAEIMVNDIEPRPVLARYTGSSIVLTLSEIVTSGTAGPNGFSVVSQNPIAVESISGTGTNSLTLLLNGTIQAGSTLSYDQNTGDVADETGKALKSFEDLPVSFPSKSRSSAPSPAITIGSQGHPVAPGTTPSGPLQPVPTDGTSVFPLVIDGNGYALHSDTVTVIPTGVTAGRPVTITVAVYDPLPILYFGIYLHLPGDTISHLQSDAQVAYDSGKIRVTDPGGLLRDISMTLSEDPDDPASKTVTLTVTFTESIGNTNMVMRTWNTDRQSTEVRIFDALAVQSPDAADPEPDAADPEPVAVVPDTADPEPITYSDTAEHQMLVIRMWSGFEPESLTDDQLLHELGLDYREADIPDWMMTELGVLAANGDVTVGEFLLALQYVLIHT